MVLREQPIKKYYFAVQIRSEKLRQCLCAAINRDSTVPVIHKRSKVRMLS